MKVKTLVLLSSIFMLGLWSCSNDKDVDPNDGNEVPKDTSLKLIAKKTVIEPFEKLTVRIDLDEELIYSEYDSVRWDAAGIWRGGVVTIPNNEDPRDVHFTNYRLGKHKIILKGYRDGKVISSPSVEYEVVSPRGDFLNVKWGKTEKFNSASYYSGLTPSAFLPTTEGSVKIGGISINRWHIADSKDGEYVHLELVPWSSTSSFSSNLRMNRSSMETVPEINDIDWHPEDGGDRNKWLENHAKRVKDETDFWYNYITALYGAPLFEYNGDNPKETTLWAEYNERFNNPPRDKACPYVIWETGSTYIAMNHYVDIRGGREVKGMPAILAEPKIKK